MEKNLDDIHNNFKYLEPYPPGYDALFGLLHQTSPSLMWTMKFFNAFLISLGILFFYFFTKNFMNSSNKALIATIILAMVPSYLSHFIWAHSLVITIFIIALYCFVMIDRNKNWIYPNILVISGIALTQPSQAMKYFVVFILFFIVNSIYLRKVQVYKLISFIGG